MSNFFKKIFFSLTVISLSLPAFLFVNVEKTYADGCKVNQTVKSGVPYYDGLQFDPYNNNGKQVQDDTWYSNTKGAGSAKATKEIAVNVVTTGCEGQTLYIELWEKTYGKVANVKVSNWPTENKLTVKFLLGTGERYSMAKDNKLFLKATTSGGSVIADTSKLQGETNNDVGQWLYYNCHNSCPDQNNYNYFIERIIRNFTFKSYFVKWEPVIENPDPASTTVVSAGTDALGGTTGTGTDQNNGSVNITPESSKSFNPDYTLLAPIGNLTVINTTKTTFGDYLNVILKIAIGACGALAVIMIVINGIMMMGSESVFGRVEAKSKITAAIGGLLLALGAWVILNTINPDLVGGKINIQGVTVTLTPIASDTPQTADANGMVCVWKGTGNKEAGYHVGDVWSSANSTSTTSDAAIRKELLPIQVEKKPCAKVGDLGCTSVEGLDQRFVNALYNVCYDDANCDPKTAIVITEGTACWAHKYQGADAATLGQGNGKKSHYPGGWTVDLQETDALKKLITGPRWGKWPTYFDNWGQCYYFANNGIAVVDEINAAGGRHYHAYSLTGGCSAAGQGI